MVPQESESPPKGPKRKNLTVSPKPTAADDDVKFSSAEAIFEDAQRKEYFEVTSINRRDPTLVLTNALVSHLIVVWSNVQVPRSKGYHI